MRFRRDLDAIARLTVLFSHTNKLEIPELAKTYPDLPENHQDKGATPPVNTHLSPLHSPPEYTSVASANPTSRLTVEARDASLQARKGYLPDIRLIVSDYIS